MTLQHRLSFLIAVTLAALTPAWTSAGDEPPEPAADAAVIVVEASGDGNSNAPVVVSVKSVDAAGAVVIRAGGNQSGAYDVREEVDPQDGVERFALLLPGGPLVVEGTLTLDGKPFRTAREALIDEMLTAGDTNGDGTLTWEEALASSRFTYGRIYPEQQRAQYTRMVDRDENGEVDRREARAFLAVMFQGPAFNLSGSSGNAWRGGNLVLTDNGRVLNAGGAAANVWALLDVDSDGILSEAEIAGAGERLKSRDADDNDLLYTNEISAGGDAAASPLRISVRNAGGQYVVPQQAVLLGPTARAEPLFAALQGQYQTNEGTVERSSFPAAADLFDQLDADGDGRLSENEALALNDVEPQIRLNVDLTREAGASTLKLTRVGGDHELANETASTVGIELPGVTVAFEVDTTGVQSPDFETVAQQRLDQFDGDKNGYLELSEMPENFGQPQFDSWDADRDGKVYKQEIADSYSRSQLPQQTQIQAGVAQSGDPVFPALDLSGDSRLSLREMKTAHVQLAALDKDGDGRITRIEVPVSFDVNFRIGGGYYGNYRVVATGRGGIAPAAAPTGDGPAWFLRMDRNGDGDVTLKEFLGDREDFEKLDTNSDGFIEPAEARAAESQNGEDG